MARRGRGPGGGLAPVRRRAAIGKVRDFYRHRIGYATSDVDRFAVYSDMFIAVHNRLARRHGQQAEQARTEAIDLLWTEIGNAVAYLAEHSPVTGRPRARLEVTDRFSSDLADAVNNTDTTNDVLQTLTAAFIAVQNRRAAHDPDAATRAYTDVNTRLARACEQALEITAKSIRVREDRRDHAA